MRKIQSLFPAMLVLLVLFSCKKDEEKPDPVSTAEGDYTYVAKFNFIDGTDLTYLDGNDETGEFKVTKTTDGGFEVKDGSDLVFKGTQVSEVSQGFTFTIEDQSVTLDGFTLTIKGYDGATFGNGKFHGTYESSTKKLTGYMQFAGTLTSGTTQIPATIVVQFVGTKK